MGEQLVGHWVTDPQDLKSLAEYGEVSLQFGAEGHLAYSIHQDGKRQIMLLTYRVEGDDLIIDQPSKLREERVGFEITPEDKLMLFSQPVSSTYLRLSGGPLAVPPSISMN